MSIEIKIPKEINDYKTRSYFGFSLRQFICIVLTLAINIPTYFFISKYLGSELASWVVILISIPMVLTGFLKYAGLPFEKFIIAFLRTTFLYPQRRIYKTENRFQTYLDRKEDRNEISKYSKKKSSKK